MSPYLFILNTHCGVTFSLSQSFEWTGSQSAFDVAAKNTSSSAILDTDRLLFVNSAESAHRTLWRHLSERNASPCRAPCRIVFSLFFRSIKQQQAQSYGGPQLSRQNRKPHGKNKIPHSKNKNLTAKTKVPRGKATNLTQNQILHSKNKIAWVLPWAFAFPISGNALGGKTKKKKGNGLTPVL